MDGTNPIEGKAPMGQQGPATTRLEPLVPAAGFPCHASSGDQSFTKEALGIDRVKSAVSFAYIFRYNLHIYYQCLQLAHRNAKEHSLEITEQINPRDTASLPTSQGKLRSLGEKFTQNPAISKKRNRSTNLGFPTPEHRLICTQ